MKTKFLFFIVILLIACNTDAIDETDYTPKPKAFVKLDFPEKVYEKSDSDCPFIFDVPLYGILEKKDQECFYDLNFPNQNGILHITYFPIKDNLLEHTEESRKYAYEHKVVGVGSISNSSLTAHGIFYDFDQTSAKAAQFHLTDSINHFFFGALYFNTEVCDSILPINIFLKEDILHLIETFHWKDK